MYVEESLGVVGLAHENIITCVTDAGIRRTDDVPSELTVC